MPSNNSEQQPLFPVIPQGLRISLSAGRPSQADLAGVVEGAIARTVSIGSGATGHEDERGINGVLVGVCGPAGLGVQANLAVNSIDSARKQQAGGVDVYEECVLTRVGFETFFIFSDCCAPLQCRMFGW